MRYLIVLFLFVFVSAKDFVSFSYERWKFNNEILGVSKLSLNKTFSQLYYGVSFFGAAEGKRGGFFTFGYDVGLKYDLSTNWYINPEFFVGAGGGGAAPQGGGLMVRPAMSVNYKKNGNSIGIGYSYVRFINGDIKSSQLFFSLSTQNINLNHKEIIVTFPITIYKPNTNVKTTDNKQQENIYLIGIKAKSILNKYLFSELNLNGAFKTSNGYMDIFLGGGVYKELFKNLNIYLLLALGEGGGGKVKTDGGVLTKTSVSLEYKIKNFNISADYGIINNSSFKSRLLSINLGINDNFDKLLKKMKYRVIVKLHNTTNKGKQYLEGLSFDYYINEMFIGGQSLWAFANNSGGYTEGLLCIGINKEIQKVIFTPEIFIGAAGGGGIDVGKGYLIGGDLNIGYKYKRITPFIGVGVSKFSNRITKEYLLGFSIKL